MLSLSLSPVDTLPSENIAWISSFAFFIAFASLAVKDEIKRLFDLPFVVSATLASNTSLEECQLRDPLLK